MTTPTHIEAIARAILKMDGNRSDRDIDNMRDAGSHVYAYTVREATLAFSMSKEICAISPRPLDEWHEDFGDVVWWALGDDGNWLGEPAYIGSPLDCGRTISVVVDGNEMTCSVGGWPGYHTHWTPHPEMPPLPENTGNKHG